MTKKISKNVSPEPVEVDKLAETEKVLSEKIVKLDDKLERFNKNSRARDTYAMEKINRKSDYDTVNELTEWIDSNIRQLYDGFNAVTTLMYEVNVKFMPLEADAVMPSYATDGSAGLDITAIDWDYDKETQTYEYKTGWAVQIPEGYVGLLFPKSGIYKKTLRLTNAVGVIDSDYRGEIKARFESNTSAFLHWLDVKSWWPFKRFGKTRAEKYLGGDKIIQMIVLPYPRIKVLLAEELSETDRGDKGFGQADEEPIDNEVK